MGLKGPSVRFCAQSGLALSVRNLSTMGAIVFGTTIVSGMGTASLAAHEILRQVQSASQHRCMLLCPRIFSSELSLRKLGLPLRVSAICDHRLTCFHASYPVTAVKLDYMQSSL